MNRVVRMGAWLGMLGLFLTLAFWLSVKGALAKGGPLKVRLDTDPAAVYTTASLPLKVILQNDGKKNLRLFKLFEPAPVFFDFRLIRPDGSPVQLPGAGKIELSRTLEYLDLAPGETYTVPVDVAALVPAEEPLEEGKYTVSVTYHNRYGQDCFHGSVSSAPVQVRLTKSERG